MVFHWKLSESNSPKVSRTLLSIQADLNNALVCMVSILPLISNSSNPFSKPLGTVPSAPTATDITVSFVFHSFLSSLSRSKYMSLFLLSFTFTLWSAGTAKSVKRHIPSFFFFVNYHWVCIRWFICILISHGFVWVSFSTTDW